MAGVIGGVILTARDTGEIDALLRVYLIPTGAGMNSERWGAIKGLFR